MRGTTDPGVSLVVIGLAAGAFRYCLLDARHSADPNRRQLAPVHASKLAHHQRADSYCKRMNKVVRALA